MQRKEGEKIYEYNYRKKADGFIVGRTDELYINLEHVIKYGSVGMVRKFTPLDAASVLLPVPDLTDEYGPDAYELFYGGVVFSVEDNRVVSVELPLEDGYIDGGEKAYIDYWAFEDTEEITLLHMEGVLSNERIPFSLEVDAEDEEIAYLKIPQSGVTLTFWASEEQALDNVFDYTLAYISL